MSDFVPIREQLERDLSDILRTELRAAGGTRLHILLESETKRRFPGWFGFTNPFLASMYADEIPECGAQPGPAVFVCDLTTSDHFAKRENALKKMIATTVHETAHVLSIDCWFGPLSIDADRAGIKQRLTAPGPSRTFPNAGHDAAFARFAVHLATRLGRRGWDFPADYLWHPRVTLLDYGRAYAVALREEIHLYGDEPLSTILGFPPPAEFVALFEQDRRRAEERRTVMITQFLSRLRSREAAAVETAQQKMKRFAVDVGHGQEPDEEELLDTLRQLDMTVEEFEKLANTIAHRVEQKALMDKEPAIQAEIDKVERMFDAQIAEFERVKTKYEEQSKAYREALAPLQEKLSQSQQARVKLYQSAPRGIMEQKEMCGRRNYELQQRITMLREHVQRNTPIVAAQKERLARARRSGDEDIISQEERQLDQDEHLLAEQVGQLEKAEAERKAIQEKMRELDAESLEV